MVFSGSCCPLPIVGAEPLKGLCFSEKKIRACGENGVAAGRERYGQSERLVCPYGFVGADLRLKGSGARHLVGSCSAFKYKGEPSIRIPQYIVLILID